MSRSLKNCRENQIRLSHISPQSLQFTRQLQKYDSQEAKEVSDSLNVICRYTNAVCMPGNLGNY